VSVPTAVLAEPLDVRRDGAVVRLTLNRPSSANTVNLELAGALRNAVRRVDDEVRVVVLGGAGGVFCGGGDVGEMVGPRRTDEVLAELASTFHDALRSLVALDAVVLAAIDGAVAGGGLGLALHADLIVATERSRFLTAYQAVGLTPDSGVTDLLPRSVGLHRALDLTMTGRVLDARTAYEWGMVGRLVADETELAEVIDGLVAHVAAHPVSHLTETRRLYRRRDHHHARLDAEAAAIVEASRTTFARERMSAYARPRTTEEER
jgi:2-(1,2-epoxy-1,2-dihydrophenyl)acetyl-CoA isomerase